MKRQIVLFTNLDFGLRFIQTILKFKKKYPCNYHTYKIYFSSKNINIKTKIKMTLTIMKAFKIIPSFVEDINNQAWIKKRIIGCDTYGVVAGFNQIFKQSTIDSFKVLINFHPSILPLYKGPSPVYWAIKYSESKIGYTIHYINDKIDEGTIIYQDAIDVETDNHIEELYRLSKFAQSKFEEILLLLPNDKLIKRRYIDANSIYQQRYRYIDSKGNITY